MTSYERVTTALMKKKPDRVPIITFLDPYTDNWASKEKSYSSLLENIEKYADILFEISNLYDPGIFHSVYSIKQETNIKDGILSIKYYTPKGLLMKSKNVLRHGYTKKHLIHTEEDVEKILSIPYKRPEINLTFVKNHILKYNKEIVPVIKLKDPMCYVGDSIEPEKLMLWTIENRRIIFSLLDIALERILDTIDYVIDNNIEGIFYLSGPEYCIPPLGSPKDFREFVVRYDKKIIDKIHKAKKLVILHSHGKVRDFLDDFVEIGTDGLDVLEPDSSMTGDIDLFEVKELYGKKLCLIGNIQYDDIANGDKNSIENLVRKTMESGKKDGGFILEPSADPYEIPLSKKTANNFITYFETAKKYSDY